MNEKKQSRLRRAKSTRLHIRALRDSFVCKTALRVTSMLKLFQQMVAKF